MMTTAITNIANVDGASTAVGYNLNAATPPSFENPDAIKWSDILEETEMDSDSYCSSPSSGEKKDDVSRIIGDLVDDEQNVCSVATTPNAYKSYTSTVSNPASSTENSVMILNAVTDTAVTTNSNSTNCGITNVYQDTVNSVSLGTKPSNSNVITDYVNVSLDAYGLKDQTLKIKLDADDTNSSTSTTICGATTSVSSLSRDSPHVVGRSGVSTPDGEMLVIVLKSRRRMELFGYNNGPITAPAVSVDNAISKTVLKDEKGRKRRGPGISRVKDNKKSFECPKCGKTFSESLDLLVHGRTHAGEQFQYDCVICGSVYSTFLDLKRHQRTHMLRKSYSCSVCGNAFSSLSYAQAYTDSNKGQPLHFECTPCGKIFFTSEHFEEHKRTHEKPTECLICGKKYSRSSYLQAHVRSHTGEKPFTCEVCGKQFASKFYLTRHVRHHVDEKRHSCTICGKAFFAKSTLTCHIRTHTGEKPYSCQICGKTFVCQGSQSKHMKIHAGEKMHQCSTCGKAFLQSRYLKVHMRTHTGEKPYVCVTCGKAFSTQSALTCHVRTHTGERPYECSLCGQAFIKSSDLQTHLRRHKGERPYSCTTCGKMFSCCTGLNLHKRIHSGVKAYKCLECGKDFTTSSSLYVHNRIHTGVKPFKCTTCGKAFIHKSHLQRHAKIHERMRTL